MSTKYHQISLGDTFSECQNKLIDASLAQMLTFDTSGIELYVKENNPKTLNALIRKMKVYYKDKPDVDPYKMAYGIMPSQAAQMKISQLVTLLLLFPFYRISSLCILLFIQIYSLAIQLLMLQTFMVHYSMTFIFRKH